MRTVEILGVKFDQVIFKEALKKALDFIKSGRQHQIVTPNPEIVLKARKDREYREILRRASLRIPDGIGILWAAKMQGVRLKERVTGTDLMEAICRESAKKDYLIFLLGADPGDAEKTKLVLEKNNPGIKIVGCYAGSPSFREEKELVGRINQAKPDILFVAYGAPEQEKWIARNLKKMPSVKLAMGVGGAFDFISGKRKRAPSWMRKLGLEWLFRLIKEPRRIRRIYQATVKFPLTFLFHSKRPPRI